jgi:uncharacterized protein YpmB
MPEEKKSSGAIIGVIIIILVLIIGGIYFFREKVSEVFEREVTEETLGTSGQEIENFDRDLQALLQELEELENTPLKRGVF